MLLKQALEDAELYADPAQPPMTGAALEALARRWMEVAAILRRSSRRYDQRVLEQLIYMPEVTLADHDRIDWLTQWGRTLEAQLNAQDDAARRYRVRVLGTAPTAALRRDCWSRAPSTASRRRSTSIASSSSRPSIAASPSSARRSRACCSRARTCRRATSGRKSAASSRRSNGCSIRRARGQLIQRYKGLGEMNPGAALGHHDQSGNPAPDPGADRRRAGRERHLRDADGRSGRAAARVHREERAGRRQPRCLIFLITTRAVASSDIDVLTSS